MIASWSDRHRAAAAGATVIVAGIGLLFIHYLGGRPHGDGNPEGWLSSIGFAAPFVAAGTLAVFGSLLSARWQWWSAGLAVVACSIVSIIMFPLLVPGIALIALGVRPSSAPALNLCGTLLATALAAAFFTLVLHQDPASWDGGGSSNVVTTFEATLSVTVSVVVLAAGAAIATATRSEP